jgi:hypothetical protein
MALVIDERIASASLMLISGSSLMDWAPDGAVPAGFPQLAVILAERSRVIVKKYLLGECARQVRAGAPSAPSF